MLDDNAALGLLHEALPTLELALQDKRLDLIAAPSVLDNLRAIEPVLHVVFLKHNAHLIPFAGLVVRLVLHPFAEKLVE